MSLRIWDIAAGYLNRQSLLGEHRELHGLYSILIHGKKGYARHPETLRWVDAVSGLIRRHSLLAHEMHLRGYVDRSPLAETRKAPAWPGSFITEPAMQYELLRAKYLGKEPGRIALPQDAQALWAQHKYSVLARDPAAYREFGRRVARTARADALTALANDLQELMWQEPPTGRLANALEHMWGYVRRAATDEERKEALASELGMFRVVQRLAVATSEPYLLASTALSELGVWLPASAR